MRLIYSDIIDVRLNRLHLEEVTKDLSPRGNKVNPVGAELRRIEKLQAEVKSEKKVRKRHQFENSAEPKILNTDVRLKELEEHQKKKPSSKSTDNRKTKTVQNQPKEKSEHPITVSIRKNDVDDDDPISQILQGATELSTGLDTDENGIY